MKKHKYEVIALDELQQYENNTRTHSRAQIAQIIDSIKCFGFTNPVLIDEHSVIIAGHGRVAAANKLGMTEVPCIRITGLTEDEVKALRIADNQLALNAGWDEDMLKIELGDLAENDFDLDLLGFPADELDKYLKTITQDEVVEDVAPEVDEVESRCKLGDIWQLGNHRLMCGDSTSEEDVARLMNGARADMLLTDPPYNVALGMNEGASEARKRHRRTDGLVIMNDKMGDEDFYKFLLSMYSCAKEVLKEGGAFYIWHADNEGLNFRRALKDAGLQLRQTLIWNKNAMTLGRQDFQWKHEPCLYGWKDGASHNWYNNRSQTTVLDFKKPSANDVHPTMKPVELFAYLISCSSKEKEVVLDLFGGSGTTIIACEQLNRHCCTMELDPKYCDVILKRWENLTGNVAEKIV